MAVTPIKPITSGYNVSKVNDNFQNLQTKVDGPLISSQDGQNTMFQDFDLNGNDLLNAGIVNVDGLTIAGSAVTITNLGAIGPNSVGNAQVVDGAITDSKIVSVNGGKVSFLQKGAGALTRTGLSKMQDTLSIMDFTGADPTGATDSTAAWLSFINQLQVTGAQGVMPSGTFNITTGVTITAPVAIRGSKQTVIRNTNPSISTPILHLTNAAGMGSILEYVTISSVTVTNPAAHGLQIDGGQDFIIRGLNISGTYTGINIPASASGAVIESCFIHNTVSHGIAIDGANLAMDNCFVVNAGGVGYNFTSVTNGGNVNITNCTTFGSGSYGFCFQGNATHGMGDIFVSNCLNSTSPHGEGFFFDTFSKNIALSNCFSELAGVDLSLAFVSVSHGFRFTPNNHRVTMTGCQATFSGGSGVSMECGYFGITGGDFVANNIGMGATQSGILVGASGAVSNFTINGVNTVPQPVTDANTQAYGICLFGTGHTQGAIAGCNVSGGTGSIFISGSPTVRITGCSGFVNEVWGTAIVPNGAHNVIVNHGMSGTPTMVVICARDTNLGTLASWVGSYTPTTFAINTSANVPADSLFSYYARF